ncbi:MAG: T9SS type A sorting domain-containing protein, partial [Bacteroidota bacterium]|nr:T9SS type A sorting domain-containing protein [Bacteroidota bacterium]
TLFPNPVNEKLTVCTGTTDEVIRFRLYDIYGKLIETFDVRGDRELDVSDVQNGIYILKAGRFHPKKIVVQ